MEHANDNLPDEVWRDCPIYPEIEASSHGRIRRKPHTTEQHNGGFRTHVSAPTFGTICKASKDARHLYFTYRYRGVSNVKVHVAVCSAFHGMPLDGVRKVRHLNENGLDNRPSNLMWSSQKTNLNDPKIRRFHYDRVSPFANTNMTKREKRAGIYDSIEDIGFYQLDLRAANDNKRRLLAA